MFRYFLAETTLLDEALSPFQEFTQDLIGRFDNVTNNLPAALSTIVWIAIQVILILLLAKIILRLLSHVTGKWIARDKAKSESLQNKRMVSVLSLVRSASRYLIYLITVVLILYAVGLGSAVSNLLAGAGIGALAIGFGAQSLVKDVVSGLFLMFENQYTVGDYVQIDDVKGTVEATALRVTYLRALNGDQIIIPNGQILRVFNYTHGNNQAIVDVATAYENDTRMVIDVINQCLEHFKDEYDDWITAPPINLGIVEMADSAIIIRIICNCQPLKQGDVERAMRLIIKEAFEATGLTFPYPHITVSYTQPPEPKQASFIKPSDSAPSSEKKTTTLRSPWQTGHIHFGDDEHE